MTFIDYDVERWRVDLDRHKRRGSSFEDAWLLVTGRDDRARGDGGSLKGWIKRHFRAAYYDSPGRLGRFNAERDEHCEPREPVALCDGPSDVRRCQSGDGCDRVATCGRFGLNWCEYHGAELERVRND